MNKVSVEYKIGSFATIDCARW